LGGEKTNKAVVHTLRYYAVAVHIMYSHSIIRCSGRPYISIMIVVPSFPSSRNARDPPHRNAHVFILKKGEIELHDAATHKILQDSKI
jgi:hypothetical protein